MCRIQPYLPQRFNTSFVKFGCLCDRNRPSRLLTMKHFIQRWLLDWCGALVWCSGSVLIQCNYHVILYVTGSAKPNTIMHFSISCVLNVYNLHSQVYSLARLQLHIPITLGVTALWSSSNRKINLYSRYWENKLQALTKTMVTYEQKDVLSYIMFTMNRGIKYWVSFSVYHYSSLQTKAKSIRKNWSRRIIFTWPR